MVNRFLDLVQCSQTEERVKVSEYLSRMPFRKEDDVHPGKNDLTLEKCLQMSEFEHSSPLFPPSRS